MPVLEISPPVVASPKALSLVIEGVPGACRPGHVCHPRGRIDYHAVHRRQVDDHAVVAGELRLRDGVAATAHRRRQLVADGEAQRGQHVGGAGAARDSGWVPVVHAVPYRSRAVVVGVAGAD